MLEKERRKLDKKFWFWGLTDVTSRPQPAIIREEPFFHLFIKGGIKNPGVKKRGINETLEFNVAL